MEYDLSRLRLPVALFYGGRDTVIDIDALVRELPNVIKLHKEDRWVGQQLAVLSVAGLCLPRDWSSAGRPTCHPPTHGLLARSLVG